MSQNESARIDRTIELEAPPDRVWDAGAKAFEDNTKGWTEVLTWFQKYVEKTR